ncbi:hypothetical protein SAMN06296386_103204 [Lachnospiraceae bacterium]|nr:hypothetical protein SAMN06296386_103204 [Lachnospiraceae bacterium]
MIYALIPILLFYFVLRVNSIESVGNNENSSGCFRLFSISLCIWAVYLSLLTEALSIVRLLTKPVLLIAWGITDIILGYCLYRSVNKRKIDPGKFLGDSVAQKILEIKESSIGIKVLYGLILVTFASVLILGILTVPYNWDSMTYHLPRIMFWAQNHSVAHYSTYDLRQLSSPYLSEYINLHQYILIGKDWFFNYIQGFSFCFCTIGIYYVTKKMGLDKKWCLLAAVLFLSTPIAYAEALSTQVDVFTTVWMVIFGYFWIDIFEQESLRFSKDILTDVIVMGTCIGLAYITKPSVCISMAVFLLILLVKRVASRDKVYVLAVSCMIAAAVIVIIASPGIIRNLMTFNAVSAKEVGARQLIGTADPRMFIVSFIKNLCFTLPSAWIRKSDKIFYAIPFAAAKILKVDLNDAAISEDGREYRVADAYDFGQDTASNSLIVWLILLSIIISIFMLIRKQAKNINWFNVGAVVSFMIFLTVLRWEPFETRYEISYLAMLCPFIAHVFCRLTNKNRTCEVSVISIILFLCVSVIGNMYIYHAITWYTKARIRPEGYFSENPICDDWYKVTDLINENDYKKIGIHSGNNYYTYPLWRMCSGISRVENVFEDENETSRYADNEFCPDAIVWFGEKDFSGGFIWNGQKYVVIYTDGEHSLLEAEK